MAEIVAIAPPSAAGQIASSMRFGCEFAPTHSFRTEEAYVGWIRRFVVFHGKRHPRELGEPEINAFLTHLAVKERVASSTQSQLSRLFSFCTAKSSKFRSEARIAESA
jgi:hypothetical protein